LLSFDGDSTQAPNAFIRTTTDGTLRIDAPAKQPCALVIQNSRATELLLQVSGPNVAAQIVQFNDDRQVVTQTSQTQSAFSTFNVKPDNRIIVLYIGSVDPVNNSTLNLAWKNSIFEGGRILMMGVYTMMVVMMIVMSMV
jgi:hypothetical protein